ncbi:alpha/beta hydrolase [Flavobacterium sp. HSC-61S13]|uniref:alpha/beta hydrolase n=1 Tax=Flavobacterium sp. HSC-61S13 TaxID=2910963 RepID=UPI00209F8877|nr:alpha/beta hydrolase [Flavobacterium sp. HSC-61S13]MCP1995611.1 pimeloyl-ACP methyl ester carboxylesterase [Flavobacterium sp. HSC-61S13]
MNKIPIYFMPGMAASSRIFEKIHLSEELFEFYYLEWLTPIDQENLTDYTARIAKNIHHENPVLIGVSFGGIIVQELMKIMTTRKTIIISSVRSNQEYPLKMKWAKTTKIYKLFPTNWLSQIEGTLVKFGSEKQKKKINLYQQYLSIRDPKYLDWAFENVIKWNRNQADPSIIHIHGDQDEVFPIQNIHQAIIVKGGTHAMIIYKHHWFNKNLSNIILYDTYEQLD